MARLTGKVALVTGGASGIGRAVVEAFAEEGAKVAIVDLTEDTGRAAAEAVKAAGGEAFFLQADVSRPEDNERMVRETVERYGALHVACNNAGIGGEANPVADYSVEGWQKVIAVNLSSVFYAMKYEIPAMLAAGGGSIVNMASILGAVGWAQSAGYVAAKHGVVGLTKSAALEYAAQGVRVNAIGPAFIRTPLISALEQDEALNAMLVSMHPVGRLGEPEEVAALAVFLASDEASFVHGAYLPVDGGFLAR
jgi:NAD(P)-dependent dehydrogenase (short-subunit alcohol dehydrogenase family)